MTAASASAAPSSSAFLAIFWGGLACGVFDITQACIAWGIQNHLSPMRIFQSIAAGLLGPKAFQGGMKTAILGGVLHFFIAFSWAAIYYIASRRLPFMVEKAVLSGLLYGELVWLTMNFVVIPLSALHRWPVSDQGFDHYRTHSATYSWWACRSRWRSGGGPENLDCQKCQNCQESWI